MTSSPACVPTPSAACASICNPAISVLLQCRIPEALTTILTAMQGTQRHRRGRSRDSKPDPLSHETLCQTVEVRLYRDYCGESPPLSPPHRLPPLSGVWNQTGVYCVEMWRTPSRYGCSARR